jgi:hypothetical protein
VAPPFQDQRCTSTDASFAKAAMKEALTETDKEKQQRSERQNNLVIYNVPESNSNLKASQDKYDMEFTEGLLATLDIPNIKPTNLVRLGRKETGKIRPLKVTPQHRTNQTS